MITSSDTPDLTSIIRQMFSLSLPAGVSMSIPPDGFTQTLIQFTPRKQGFDLTLPFSPLPEDFRHCGDWLAQLTPENTRNTTKG